MITDYHSQLYANGLTLRAPSGTIERLDAIDAERDKLIENAEKSLQKPIKSQIIFAIDWRIV